MTATASRNWMRHLFLVSGYATIFTLVVVFLPWFQIEDSSFHWTSILGYYSTAVLLVTTAWMLLDRIGKRTEMHRFSHLSDWLFPILLFLTALTGILVNIFPAAESAHADLRYVCRPHGDCGADAGGGSSVRQVGAPAVQAARNLCCRGEKKGAGIRERGGGRCRPSLG